LQALNASRMVGSRALYFSFPPMALSSKSSRSQYTSRLRDNDGHRLRDLQASWQGSENWFVLKLGLYLSQDSTNESENSVYYKNTKIKKKGKLFTVVQGQIYIALNASAAASDIGCTVTLFLSHATRDQGWRFSHVISSMWGTRHDI
jgi:hypothetical protein